MSHAHPGEVTAVLEERSLKKMRKAVIDDSDEE